MRFDRIDLGLFAIGGILIAAGIGFVASHPVIDNEASYTEHTKFMSGVPKEYIPECPWMYVNSNAQPREGIFPNGSQWLTMNVLSQNYVSTYLQHISLGNTTFHFVHKLRTYSDGFKEMSDGIVRNGQYPNGTYWYTISWCPPGVNNALQ